MGLFKWLFGTKESGGPDKSRASPPPLSPGAKSFTPAPAAMPQTPGAAPTPRAQNSNVPEVVYPGKGFPLDAVGESNFQPALKKICGGHNREGHELETRAILKRQPENPHDVNAVVVLIENKVVGYLPREQAARVAQQMREDGITEVRCRAEVVGGWRTNQHDEGSFGVKLAVPRRGWIDFGLGKSKPKSAPGTTSTSSIPEAASNGPLAGQKIVLWGAPQSGDLANELAGHGAQIMAGVGKSTTMVVYVADELTAGMKSSATYRKAQDRISSGAALEILSLSELHERLQG